MSEATTSESESDKEEVELLEEDPDAPGGGGGSRRRVATRSAKDKEPLVSGLEEAREEALGADKGWWHQVRTGQSFNMTSPIYLSKENVSLRRNPTGLFRY